MNRCRNSDCDKLAVRTWCSRACMLARRNAARRQRVNRKIGDAQNRAALHAYALLGRTPRVVVYRDWGDIRRHDPDEALLPNRTNDLEAYWQAA